MSTSLMGDSCLIVNREYFEFILRKCIFLMQIKVPECPNHVACFEVGDTGYKLVHHNKDDIPISGTWKIDLYGLLLLKTFIYELSCDYINIDLWEDKIIIQAEPSSEEPSFFEITIPVRSEWKDR